MSTHGTIGRPAPYGPRRHHQLRAIDPRTEVAPSHRPVGRRQSRQEQNRTRKLQLIPEAMARSHMEERTREATSHRMAGRLADAQRQARRSERLQRRAERASRRARRALARAVMQ
ncbi:hypothetical protein FH609_000080 [Streptomyces sp. 3MP-14]|uniref:Uncharacterized protein n=2 Tax=Streptomyces TaxID=1883 RepID=A0A5N6ATD7_9ACTN|nr:MULTISPECIES: hypothetical protein [Streptomyces]KAB8171180.1 hypothetical protein FH607_002390 [Streptomyces mimosae]KAB8179468.1 hypothetical protein FH609_000080 [Streptomyces sp. 3MP-14]